jgi:hypothetical protein
VFEAERAKIRDDRKTFYEYLDVNDKEWSFTKKRKLELEQQKNELKAQGIRLQNLIQQKKLLGLKKAKKELLCSVQELEMRKRSLSAQLELATQTIHEKSVELEALDINLI